MLRLYIKVRLFCPCPSRSLILTLQHKSARAAAAKTSPADPVEALTALELEDCARALDRARRRRRDQGVSEQELRNMVDR